MPDRHEPAFTLLRQQMIPALNITVSEYRHQRTGATHIHMSADNAENVFLVALRTMPQDSTGVAHILEHTALCGSRKYPVRDPFFMMIRRSLNTFMNAFTSTDWTAYPFASQNHKDFDNLLQVYLDAVFFANLDPLDFAQEGHRVEFAEPDNPASELVFKGVVYNEMKGAMSSVASQLWQKLSSHLFPSSTYHYNSGGDPEFIPDLTHAQLLDFYRQHYHPANAIFMTYGDIPAAEHQANFERLALAHFEPLDVHIAVAPEKRLHAPIRVEDAYALDTDESLDDKTHVVLGWLLGEVTDMDSALEAHLIAMLLLDNSASPLLQALETSTLGQAPSPLCGLEDSNFEMSFVCGLEGCAADATLAVESLILDTLQQIAEEGIAADEVEAALHQLELSQREVGGDGFPYGLQLIMSALPAASHRGDIFSQLDLESALVRLREKIAQPDFVRQSIQRYLLDNSHRVTLTLRPDTQFSARAQAAEKARLARLADSLDEEQRQAINQCAEALALRQEQVDDESILPKVGLEDIAPHMPYIAGSEESVNGYPLRCYSAGTNGLVYQQLAITLPALSEEEQELLPLYSAFLTELGLGEEDYLAVQRRQARHVGSISARSSIRQLPTDGHPRGYLLIATKSLARHFEAASELLRDTLQQVRFDEHTRLRTLVAQMRTRREQSITGSGHSLAMTAAAAGINALTRLHQQQGGLVATARLIALDNRLEQADELQYLASALAALHQRLLSAPRQFLLVGEKSLLADYRRTLQAHWPAIDASEIEPLQLSPPQGPSAEGWITNTQINFCAQAYPTVTSEHPDAAALTVLAGVLRNGFLHRRIREQGGAYGGGASQDNLSGAFRFYSYRDPRLAETLQDFTASIQWLLETPPTPEAVEQAILGVIGSLDKPGSPAGEAQQHYVAELFDRSREMREAFRQRVIQVSAEDLQRVAQTYLLPELAGTAVITGAAGKDELEELGLVPKTLQ